MSKTQQDIFNEMMTAKNAEPSLSALNSNSNTAIYRLWMWLVSFAHKLLYDAWDLTKSELSVIASQQNIGTPAWYEGLALNWTAGVGIAVANCKESLTPLVRKVVLKVATLNPTTGQLVNLPQADLDALRSYILSTKVMGTDIDVVSQSADLLWLGISIKYNGTLSVVKITVETAIKNHLINHPFGTNLSVTILMNELFSISNVLDVTLNYAKLDVGLGYVLQPQNILQTDAGYFEIGKDVSGNDLLDLNMYQ